MQEIISNNYLQVLLRVIIIVAAAIVLKFIVNLYFSKLSKRLIRKETKEEIRLQETRLNLIRRILSVLILLGTVVFLLSLIPGFKNVAYSLVAGAGVLAIVIGFATQKTLSNIVSGMFIALYAPFRIGDKLKIFDEYGEVEDLSLRHTIIRTWDNKRLVIPNSIIDDKEILNFSLRGERVLWTLNLGISYDSDIDKAKKVMLDKVKEHPDNLVFEENGKEEEKLKREPFVRVTECGDFAVNLRLYFWAADAWKAWKMSHDLTEQIKKEFDKRGIEIPFPYRTIVYKKDLQTNK